MTFHLQKASCVVVGTFNMYILHPQWLVKREIINKDSEVGIETNLARPGFRFHFPESKSLWIVGPDRIAIESKKGDVDCGRMVARVLEALPETPLFALGSNVVYEAELEELKALPKELQGLPCRVPEDLGARIAQRTFHVGVRQDETEIANIQLAIKAEKLELACNFHTKLEGRADANEVAVTAARRFFEHRRRSTDLAAQLLEVAIHHDHADS